MGRKRAQPSKHFRIERSPFRVNEIRSACTASITRPIHTTPIGFEYYAAYLLYSCSENGEVSACIILYTNVFYTYTNKFYIKITHTHARTHFVCGVYSNCKTSHRRTVVFTLSHQLYRWYIYYIPSIIYYIDTYIIKYFLGEYKIVSLESDCTFITIYDIIIESIKIYNNHFNPSVQVYSGHTVL